MRLHSLFLLLFFYCQVCDAAFSDQRPNILLILADDMGYGDLSFLGSKTVDTPHLDQLAKSGVYFSRAYVASSVCSPSRAGLITGRDPRRFGYEGNLNDSSKNYAARPELLGLPIQEHTIADHLKALEYETALIGKWHLGSAEQFHPNRRGFDYFCGMLGGGHEYFLDADDNKIQRNGRPLKEFSNLYLTSFFSDEAIRWIQGTNRSNNKAPWFLYLSYNAPHTPMQATDQDLAAFENVQDSKRRTYAAMMKALDRGVGRIYQSLEATDQLDNTLIVFLSDNGGATNNASWNGPLSGAKGTFREGGIRVPMIWSWQGKIKGDITSTTIVSSLDLLPTFIAAANGKPLPQKQAPEYHDSRNEKRLNKTFGIYDGLNLMPLLLESKSALPDRSLFWRLQGQAAILNQGRKLIRLSHRPAQLFDTSSDIGERNDLLEKNSQDAMSLFARLAEWESMLPTVPIWDSSPFWTGDSARIYDQWSPHKEPN